MPIAIMITYYIKDKIRIAKNEEPLLFYTEISIGIVHPTCPLVHH
jgi:hypothetical protein